MSSLSAAASLAGVALNAAASRRRAQSNSGRAERLVVSAEDKMARTAIDLDKRWGKEGHKKIPQMLSSS